MKTQRKQQTRAAIMVHRWQIGSEAGAIEGERVDVIALPVARIAFVESTSIEIWTDFMARQRGESSARSLIKLSDEIVVIATETVEQLHDLINAPVKRARTLSAREGTR